MSLNGIPPNVGTAATLSRIRARERRRKGSDGCYVATAVYGSYNCPEVWILRRFRDHTLAKTRYGRAFIRVYYAISPTFVKWFGKRTWFTSFWRGKLDQLVSKLQNKGYASSPYEDTP